MLAWSHPADPGTVPVSWNYTDPTKDTGRKEFADSNGVLLDCLPLGKTNVIYKEDAIYAMQYIGGAYVFRFDRVNFAGTSGLLSQNCAVTIGERHFVVTQDDIIVHNLANKESILDSRRRKALFGSSSILAYKERCFAITKSDKDEIWFCYPETNYTQPNRALVWNYKTGTIGDRDLTAECPYAAVGVVQNLSGQTIDSDSGLIDSDSSIIDERLFDPTLMSVLIARTGGSSRLLHADVTDQFSTSNMTSYVERTGLAFTKKDRNGNLKADFNSIKYVKRIIPRIKASGSVNFYLGSQDQKEGAVTWSGPFVFNPATDYEIFTDVVGKFIGIKVQSTTNVWWELDGYDLDVEVVGVY